jgi:hypothetical protein
MYNGIGHGMYNLASNRSWTRLFMALNYNFLKVSDKRVILFQSWSNLEDVNC